VDAHPIDHGNLPGLSFLTTEQIDPWPKSSSTSHPTRNRRNPYQIGALIICPRPTMFLF
jgi:hypothetical protein